MNKTVIKEWSFIKGMRQVKLGESDDVRREIMAVLRINNMASWYRRLNGSIIPKADEKENIEKVLSKYGVKKAEIWGE